MKISPLRGLFVYFVYTGAVWAQVFPGNTAQNKDLYVAVGGVSTTLTATVQASSTSFSVASVANMQPFELLVVDSEIVEECSFNAATLTVTLGKNSCPGADGRGVGGTSATTHTAGARIADFITAEHHNSGRKEIEAIETALGANLQNVPGTANGPATPITKGGTGATTQGGALANILGVSSLTANGVCFTQTAGPSACIPPGAAGTVLTSTGTASLPNWGAGGGGGGGVSSVFGRMGTVAAQAGDYTAALVTNAVDQTGMYPNPAWITSLAWSKITGAPGFITNPMITAGDFMVGGTAGAPTRLPVPGTGTFCPNWSSGGAVTWIACPGAGGSGITSVGITMPSGFTVTGSPLTANGVIGITGAGNATQYINGLGQLATLPTTVTSVFGRTGAVVAASGDYTTAQVTEMTNLYFTNARVYASLSATAPIVFSGGVISCPTCGSGGGGAVSSVFGRTGVVVAAAGDYNATQVTNAENVTNKDTNGGYVGRSSAGSATLPASVTANTFLSSDSTHTSLVSLIPGANTNFPYTIPTGQWGVFLDSGNGNKMTRQDSLGNKVVVEQAGTLVTGQPYVQSFTSATSVTLTHNLNITPITAFNSNCFDSTGTQIFPSSLIATNANTVTVTFAVATSGSCTVTTGGTGASGAGITQLTGDVAAGPGSGIQAATLATVNSASGACGDATHVCAVTTNGKGLVTSQSAVVITGGGSPSVGAVNHVQTSNGSGAFLDGGCTMVSSAVTCGTTFLASGGESAAVMQTSDTLYFDSTSHIPAFIVAGGSTAAANMIVPMAARTANQFLINIPNTGIQATAAIVAADLPSALTNSVSINGTAVPSGVVLATAGSGGNLTTSGAFNVTLTATATTNVTLPTSGTLQTTTGSMAAMTGLTASQIPAALSSTTSVNGTTIPAASTLLTNGGALGTPSSGTATNITGLPVGGMNVGAMSFPCNVTSALAAGTACGFGVIPVNSQSAAYTLLITDQGGLIYHPTTDATARTFTIPANGSVAYPVGSCISFINDTGAGAVTIAITTDTLILAGAGTTGSRTLAANGVATACKMTTTRWMINGTGLT